MPQVLSGLNRYGAFVDSTDTPIGQAAGINLRINDFTIELATEETEIKAFDAASVDGKLETLTEFTNSRKWSLTLKMAAFNWHHFQHLIGEFAQTTASYNRWEYKTGILDASGVLVDNELNGRNPTDVRVSIAEDDIGGWGSARQLKIVTAPVNGDEIQLDNTAETLTSAAFAGAPINYWINKAYTNIETIGVEGNPQLITDLSFEGTFVLEGDPSAAGIGVKIPKMTKNGGFTLAVNGGETNADLKYTPKRKAGYRSVVEWYRLT